MTAFWCAAGAEDDTDDEIGKIDLTSPLDETETIPKIKPYTQPIGDVAAAAPKAATAQRNGDDKKKGVRWNDLRDECQVQNFVLAPKCIFAGKCERVYCALPKFYSGLEIRLPRVFYLSRRFASSVFPLSS